MLKIPCLVDFDDISLKIRGAFSQASDKHKERSALADAQKVEQLKAQSPLVVEAEASAPQVYTDLAGVKSKRKSASLRKRIDVFPAGAYEALEATDLKEDYDSSTGYLRIDVPLRRVATNAGQRSSLLLRETRKRLEAQGKRLVFIGAAGDNWYFDGLRNFSAGG